MDQTVDDNPLVKTDTDESHTSQTNDDIELSNMETNRSERDRQRSRSTNEEESILLQTIEKGPSSTTTEGSIDYKDGESSSKSTDAILVTFSDSTSSNESVCRICQLASKETGEDMANTECSCRGNMSAVHQSCLRQWVFYKGSNKCEICHGRFTSITPPSSPGILQREALNNLTWQIERTRPFNRRKRAIMTSVIVFLIIVTVVTAMLTVSADREFERLSKNPWVTQEQVNNSNVIFSICIAFSFFCATMTIGLIIIWFGMECCFIMHRRGLLRRATAALLRDSA